MTRLNQFTRILDAAPGTAAAPSSSIQQGSSLMPGHADHFDLDEDAPTQPVPVAESLEPVSLRDWLTDLASIGVVLGVWWFLLHVVMP